MSDGMLNIESPIVLQASQSGIAIGPRGIQGIQGLAMQGVQGVQGIQGLMVIQGIYIGPEQPEGEEVLWIDTNETGLQGVQGVQGIQGLMVIQGIYIGPEQPEGEEVLWIDTNETGLQGTKTYYVSDTQGGSATRKLIFQNGMLVSET